MFVRIFLLCALLAACDYTSASDPRYCGEPKRHLDGTIARSQTVLDEFERLYPLPLRFRREDFQINHAVPLVCGGCDAVGTLIWMAKPAKTCAEWYCQDRHEQLTMCPKNFHR